MLHRHASPAVAGSYLVGSIAGAASTVAVLVLIAGLVSPVPAVVRACMALAVIAVLLAREIGLVRLSLWHRHFQIDRDVLLGDPRPAAARFAFELGLGFRTYITTAAPYAFAVALVLGAGRPGGAASIGQALATAGLAAVGFGCGRSVIVVSHACARAVAVQPPEWALRAASLLSLAASAIYVIHTIV